MKTVLSFVLALALTLCALPGLAESAVTVSFHGENAVLSGGGAAFDGGVLTITAGGAYILSGALENGQIRVEAEKTDKVTLRLNGLTVTNSAAPCIYIASCDKTVIELEAGSENLLVSGTALPAAPDSAASGAALQAKDDLTIRGEGRLVVCGYLNNGIQTSNDLRIKGGEIEVTAANNGLKGKDSILVEDGALTVRALGDGLTSDGPIEFQGGSASIVTDGGHTISAAENAGGDQSFKGGAVSAPDAGSAATSEGKTDEMPGGDKKGGAFNRGDRGFNGSFGGPGGMMKGGRGDEGNPNKDKNAHSAKGIKSAEEIIVSGGTIAVDARDDGLHAARITISGGSVTVSSDDDGLHADDTLAISGGEVLVPVSYEALEGKKVLISGGNISVYATDDGINAADGEETAIPGRMPRENDENASRLEISGGNVTVIAEVDGLDSNGYLNISGGNILVRGQNQSFDGAIDSDYTAVITGGTLFAIGGGNGFGAGSTQCSFAASFAGGVPAGETFTVTAADGTVIYTAVLPRALSVFTFSAPALAVGETYTVTAGDQTATVTQNALSAGNAGAGNGFARGGFRP